MKTYSITKQISSFILFILIVLSTWETYSQHVITFIDGTELRVHITYQTKDTVKYFLESRPEVVYVQTMPHIASIEPIKHSTAYNSDSLKNVPYGQEYLHARHITNTGIVFLTGGVVITVLGIVARTSIKENQDFDFTSDAEKGISTGLIVFGGAMIITGTILTFIGSSNKQKYEKKLHGFTFDLRCTPQVKGISVAYRF